MRSNYFSKPLFWLRIWLSLPKAGRAVSGFVVSVAGYAVPLPANNYRPTLLQSRFLALWAVLFLAVKMLSVSLIAYPLPVLAKNVSETSLSSEALVLEANYSRKQQGLKLLSLNSLLNSAAQKRAEDMAAKGYFSHISPEGKSAWQFIESAGYKYLLAGENLALNFSQTEKLQAAWMRSASHRANILKPEYEEIGIGIARGMYMNQEVVFVAELFGTQAEQNIKISNLPTLVSYGANSGPANFSMVAGATTQAANSETFSVLPEELKILQVQAGFKQDFLEVKVQTQGPAVKGLVKLGAYAAMLEPKENGWWQARLEPGAFQHTGRLQVLAFSNDRSVSLDLDAVVAGSGSQSQFEKFSPVLSGSTETSLLSQESDSLSLVQQFYLVSLAAILVLLILNLAVFPRIQNLHTIAQTALLALFCLFLGLG